MPSTLDRQAAVQALLEQRANVVAGVVLDRDDQMYNSTDNSIMGGYPAGINIAN